MDKKKIGTKITAFILTMLMIFAIMPFSALAQEDSNAKQTASTQQNVEYQASNAVGNMILQAADNQEEASADYAIQSVKIDGTDATTELSAKENCTLVIAVYDNEGIKMLGSGSAAVEASETAETQLIKTTISIDDMPEYYYVKAFLLNEDNVPICKQYESREYTIEFEEFMAKTTDDFEEYRVINLDESDDSNFLVVNDSVEVIEAEYGENTVATDDYENGVYVIENANSDIKNLKKGDAFYYNYGSGVDDYIIAKVDTVTVSGSTVKIKSADVDEMTDLFQYAKIDDESYETTVDESTIDPDITYEKVGGAAPQTRAVDFSGEAGISDKWTGTIELSANTSVKFSVGIGLKFSCKLYIDLNLFGRKYAYVEAVIKYNADFDVSVNGKIPTVEKSLPTVGMATKAGVKCDVALVFIVEASLKVDAKFSLMAGAIGFAFDTDTGAINKCKAAILDFTPEIKDEASVFIGVALRPEIQLTKNAEASIEGKVGVEITGKLPIFDNDESKHDCAICIDGDIKFKGDCGYKVKLFKWLERSSTLLGLSADIADFYFSTDIGFGWGRCPNISYKVTVTVTDENKKPLKNLTVNDSYKTDDNGKAVLYLKAGNQKINVKPDYGDIVTKEINITDHGIDVTVSVDTSIKDGGTLDDNLAWKFFKNGKLVISGSGNMNCKNNIPWANYKDEITSIIIEDGVKSIESAVFEDCTNLRDLYIGNDVSIIGASAFKNCDRLTNVSLPDSITEIDNYAFFSCDRLSNINIPNGVNIIGEGAFYRCTSLIQIIIPDSVTSIGEKAFQYCESLTNVKMSNNIQTIQSWTFDNCTNLTSVILPNDLKTIKNYVFYGCRSLQSLSIPLSITSIGNDAFYNCNSFSTVYYEGSQEQWNRISISGGNSNLKNANIICNLISTKEASAPMMLMSRAMSAGISETLETAVSGNDYIMLIVKDKHAENLLSPENLLYIDQKTAYGETLTFDFELNDNSTDYQVLFSGAKLTAEEPTPPEHTHSYTQTTTPPTCTEDGEITYTCSGCGDTYTETIPATGHDYIRSVKNATCTEDGEIDYICSVCGSDYTEVIPATGHIDNNGDNKCDNCGMIINEQTYTLGDLNDDSKITAADARLALRISAKLEKPTEIQLLAADVNSDGKITAADARKILRVSAKLDTF